MDMKKLVVAICLLMFVVSISAVIAVDDSDGYIGDYADDDVDSVDEYVDDSDLESDDSGDDAQKADVSITPEVSADVSDVSTSVKKDSVTITGKVTFNGDAPNGAYVEVFANGKYVGKTQIDDDKFSITINGLDADSYKFEIKVRGNSDVLGSYNATAIVSAEDTNNAVLSNIVNNAGPVKNKVAGDKLSANNLPVANDEDNKANDTNGTNDTDDAPTTGSANKNKDNSTKNTTNNSTKNTKNNNSVENVTKKEPTQEVPAKPIVKQQPKAPEKQQDIYKTGLPIVALVLVVLVAIIIIVIRKKQ